MKKRKCLKKILAILLAAGMTIGNCCPAWAAPDAQTLTEQSEASEEAVLLTDTEEEISETDTQVNTEEISVISEAQTAEEISENETEESSEENTEQSTEEISENETEHETEEIPEESIVITGDDTITEDGSYQLAADATGTITIAEGVKNVTITGNGAKWDNNTSSDTYGTITSIPNSNVLIDCTAVPGITLTLKNMYISNSGVSHNLVDFSGIGNTLIYDGTIILDHDNGANGYAAIHVGTGTSLTIYGTAGSSAYLYKAEQAAGIGANNNEACGNITFGKENGTNDFYLYMKGSKQGAVIGNGANCPATPGNITFYSGIYNLIAVARGALIGGSAGASSQAAGNVYIKGGLLNLNVDYSGAAIGGGGYSTGNDKGGGNVYMLGGSVRPYVDENAVNQWPAVAETGVNDAVITANKVNENEEPVYMLAVDTESIEASEYTIKVDGKVYYVGPRYESCYYYEKQDRDENWNTAPNGTPGNWVTMAEETNFYLYLTGEDHKVEVNGVTIWYGFDEQEGSFYKITLMPEHTGQGTITVSDRAPKVGDKVTVTAVPADGYYLAQVRYEYNDGTEDVYEIFDYAAPTGDSYTLTMPAEAATVTADFISIVWDGTIDITWYDPKETTIKIYYPAQFAGVAALDNGIFNDYPLYIDEEYNLVPHTDEETSLPYGYSKSGYNLFETIEEDMVVNQTAVVGNIGYLKANCSSKRSGSNNQVTTESYWYGEEDFKGKTVLLMNDLDMGGSYTGDRHDVEAWTGPNYMPIGGQYCMNLTNGYTHVGSSFNGTLDGQGYAIYNVYCYRWGATNYGDFASIGIIGRLGVHDNDEKTLYADVAVRNLAVDGLFYGRRHVGAVVGKIGKTLSAVIENCVNFATVKNTDAKGAGGICGAAWNGAELKNCVNFGHVSTSYNKNAGGISGSCEAAVTNCYNFGYVGTTHSNKEAAQALGTNNGGCYWKNCYWLTGSSAGVLYPDIYGANKVMDTVTEITIPEEFKTTEFLNSLCGNTRAWALSSDENIRSEYVVKAMHGVSSYTSELLPYDVMGMPVPRTFIYDNSTFTEITTEGTPQTVYISGQTFNGSVFHIYGNYSDGSREEILDYTVTYDTEGADSFSVGDKQVTISGEYCGETYSYTFNVEVEQNELKKFRITVKPTCLLYATGETLDTTGMIAKATYTNGITAEVTDYTLSHEGSLTSDVKTITVSYTYNGVTMTADFSIEVMESEAPEIIDGVVQLKTAENLRWFSNYVYVSSSAVDEDTVTGSIDAILLNDIEIPSTMDWYAIGSTYSNVKSYNGTFDGNHKTITFDYNNYSYYNGLFAYLGQKALVKDVTVTGILDVCFGWTGGIAAVVDGGVIKNCVNEADIYTFYENCAGGIAGQIAASSVITGCVNKGNIYSTHFCQDIGGIVGYAFENGWTVQNSMNYGTITSNFNAGGIIGEIDDNGTVLNCGNEGAVSSEISSDIYYAGGIAGTMTRAATIDSCYNKGTVIANTTLGGIVGQVSKIQSVITNCYNTGAVTLTVNNNTYQAGGIAGILVSAKCPVENCYNAGTVNVSVETTNTSIGSLFGQIKATADIKNNYMLQGTGSSAIGNPAVFTDENAKMVTAEELKALAVKDETGENVLGNAYASADAVYPVLKWEEGIYAVTVDGTGAEDVIAAEDAVEQEAYSFTITGENGYGYVVSVKIAGLPCTDFSVEEAVYTIPSEAVNGNIVISVEKVKAAEIISQPVDYTGEVGENAVFTVEAEGKDLTYQWQYKNADASTWKNSGQNGNATAELSVPITAARNGQSYRCVVTDETGNSVISNAATLYIKAAETAVKIISQPEDYTGAAGATAVFKVEAEGEGLSYQWQYKNADASTWKNSSQSGNKTAELSVPITTARNGQSYRCVVTDETGNSVTSEVGILYVGVAAETVKITSQPEDYTGAVGATAIFKVEAEGKGLSYQWQYKNADATSWKNSSQSGNKTAELNVPITAARDGQSYRCVVTDETGNSVTSEVGILYVGVAAETVKIISQPEDYTGTVGATAVFKVEAEGEGLSYQWQYKNADASTWKNSSQSGNKTAELSVPITTARNGQGYRCVVTDETGNSVTSDAVILIVNTAK